MGSVSAGGLDGAIAPTGSVHSRGGYFADGAASEGGRGERDRTIGYVVPDGQALAKANELADMVAANGPVAVQAVLRSLRETECIPEDEAMRIESKIGMDVFLSEDAKEGPLAFMQKRKPEFKGR